ncbi:MAG: dihydropteroate synthase [Actinomycetota bacterium]
MTPDVSLPDGSVLRLSGRTHVMGIINVTPDSFSDGGSFYEASLAIDHGLRLADEGADILDVGGESTRPGAAPVDQDEEIRRTAHVVEALASKTGLPISIDTTKSSVARAALDNGAMILNDVSAARFDPLMLELAATRKAPIVLMHMQGEPRTMQTNPTYDDVVEDVRSFLHQRCSAAMNAGIPREQIIVDPGIGFGKTVEHNLRLLNRLDRIADLGFAVLSGPSRKSFIGKVLGGASVDERLEGTAAAIAISIARGASIIRVHDVRAMVRVARMTDAIAREKEL